jgi:flavin reductase (DIM6/NTAB) family NADH-FMN oxidoreductase RutF
MADIAVGQPRGRARAVAAAAYRSLMSTFPTGVGIVTAVDAAGGPWGMTCSSICGVSLDPPVVLTCLRAASPTLNAMLQQRMFALNLLHDGAQHSAELFSSGAPDRFSRVNWQSGPSFGGPHLSEDAHAIADCEIVKAVPVGDHVVVFGQVYRVELRPPEPPRPLIYGLRRYSSWSRSPGTVDAGD